MLCSGMRRDVSDQEGGGRRRAPEQGCFVHSWPGPMQGQDPRYHGPGQVWPIEGLRHSRSNAPGSASQFAPFSSRGKASESQTQQKNEESASHPLPWGLSTCPIAHPTTSRSRRPAVIPPTAGWLHPSLPPLAPRLHLGSRPCPSTLGGWLQGGLPAWHCITVGLPTPVWGMPQPDLHPGLWDEPPAPASSTPPVQRNRGVGSWEGRNALSGLSAFLRLWPFALKSQRA